MRLYGFRGCLAAALLNSSNTLKFVLCHSMQVRPRMYRSLPARVWYLTNSLRTPIDESSTTGSEFASKAFTN
jgi:hypothetical protein